MGLPEQRDKENAQRDWITQLVLAAQRRKFYGKITITFQAGAVRQAVQEESLLPPLLDKK